MDLTAIPAFVAGDTINVVVESPRGSALKLKYEPRWQAMSVSRPLAAGLVFPFDWGFVPSTQGPDDDPVDACLIWDVPGFPGLVVPSRAVAVLQVEQNATNFDRSRRIRNDRILAMPASARRGAEWKTLADIPRRLLEEYEQFASAATALEGKDVTVLGWADEAEALELVRRSLRRG
jgi:inorganic pyrophosphatase